MHLDINKSTLIIIRYHVPLVILLNEDILSVCFQINNINFNIALLSYFKTFEINENQYFNYNHYFLIKKKKKITKSVKNIWFIKLQYSLLSRCQSLQQIHFKNSFNCLIKRDVSQCGSKSEHNSNVLFNSLQCGGVLLKICIINFSSITSRYCPVGVVTALKFNVTHTHTRAHT